MPPRGLKSQKRTRQYEHVKESELARGLSPARAKQIAARTVNKLRSKAGEAKTAPRSGTAGKTSRAKSTTARAKSTTARAKSTTAGRGKSTSGRSRSTSSRAKR